MLLIVVDVYEVALLIPYYIWNTCMIHEHDSNKDKNTKVKDRKKMSVEAKYYERKGSTRC